MEKLLTMTLKGIGIILKPIWAFVFYNLIIIHKGAAIAKFKSTLILSLATVAPLGLAEVVNEVTPIHISLLDSLKDWMNNNGGYILFVLIAVFVDWVLGSIVHLVVKKDFSFKKNALGVIVKLGLVFCIGALFEGFNFIYTEKNAITEYLSYVSKIMVFLYPAGSAFMNSAILTNGKFPPTGLMNWITNFNKNLKIKNDGNE